MFPDSRRPRRLPIVISAIEMTPISTRRSLIPGSIEMSCSTADEVDTATVMT